MKRNILDRQYNRRRKEINLVGICLIILVFFQLCVLINGEDKYCLRCEDFNRELQKEKKCAETYKDCGECISGYVEDSGDERVCFALEILESPAENISKKANEEVYLICKFNANIKCKWTKNKLAVDINSNNNYVWSNSNGESKNGLETDDCSINIKSLTNADSGEWVCSNMADSAVDSVKSKASFVSIKSEITKGPSPKYDVYSGQSLIITCQFDSEVKCSWMRRGAPIASQPNYKYEDKTPSKDCSITLQSIKLDEDLGEWKCSKPGDSYVDAIESKTILQSQETIPKVRSLPMITMENTVEKPSIFYQNVNVSTRILQYSKTENSNELLLLHCRGSSASSARVWWLLHRSTEFAGKVSANNDVFVDQSLSEAIEGLLEIGTEVELWCIWEDDSRRTQSAMVTIINDVDLPQIEETVIFAGINSNAITGLIIIVVILMVMIFAAMGFLAYHFWNQKGKSKRKANSQEKLFKTNT